MKFWILFIREKKTAILLYLATVVLFLVTGGLYHVENLEKLLYGALLTFALWCTVGIVQGVRYVDKCRRLALVREQLEQQGILALGELYNQREAIPGGERYLGAKLDTINATDGTRSMEQRLEELILLAGECLEKERSAQEEKAADQRDYYLLWTHQIKTPISALRLLLEKNTGSRDGSLMQEELFKIEQYADMALTFQRLDSMASDLVLQEYDLAALLKQAVRKYAVLFINKGLSVEVPEGSVKILTDQKWFSFCLEQLLSNSIKYTEKGGISFAIAEEEKAVRLTLTDTGIGIRAEDVPRIFEKGFTGYNGRLDKKSTGIGLYLSKQVFDRLGISVTADSEVGVGTRMIMTIPKSTHTARN